MKALRPLYSVAIILTLTAGMCPDTAVVATQNNPFKGLEVDSPSRIVALGEEVTFKCTPRNENNTETNGTMSYGVQGSALVQSDNPVQAGSYVLLKAVARGFTTITCTFKAASTGETQTASGLYEVKDLVVLIEPASSTVLRGAKRSLTATARHPGTGAPIPVSEGSFTWTSGATQFVTVGPTGTTETADANGINVGSATVTATFNRPPAFGHILAQTGSGTAAVNVVADPNAASLTVTTPSPAYTVTAGTSIFVPYTVQTASGAAVTDATITTSTTGTCSVLSTSAASVLVRGDAGGSCGVTITATKDGATGSRTVPVTVNAAPATAAVLVGAGTGSAAGTTRQLFGITPTGDVMTFAAASATLVTTVSLPLANQTATTFTSSNTAVATVSSTGLVTAVSAGTAGIVGTWTFGGVNYQANFSQLVGPLETATPSSITIATMSGLSSTVRVGKVTAYLCTASTGGVPVVANQVWTSSNTSVATVNSAGVVTGVSAGSATITCNINSRTTTMSTTVTP